MAKISSQQKHQNFLDMIGMMNDYNKQFSRFPTTKEFEEKLGMSEATVKRYKNPIIKQMKQKLLDEFNDDMIFYIKKSKISLDKHSEICEKIRDDTSNDNNDKINASKNIVEANLDMIRLIEDTEKYLKIEDDDNVSKNGQEYNYRQTEEEARTEESIESMFN